MSAIPAIDAAAAFYPPFPTPPDRRPGFPRSLLNFGRNAFEVMPEAIYREPIVVLTERRPHVAYVCGPELLREVLVDRFEEFPKDPILWRFFRPLVGNGILTVNGPEWRWQRRMAAPLFRQSELLRYAPVMAEAAEATLAAWRKSPPGSAQPINRAMMRATLHVIANTILAGGGEGVADAIELGREDYGRGANWWFIYSVFNLPYWLPRPGGRRMRAHERRVRAAVGELVRARRAAQDDRDDLLARMLRASDPESGQSMTGEHLVDNLMTFIIAGFDTTATTLTWALYLLSQSPEWEAKVLEEVRRVVPSGPVTAEHIPRLQVVQQVVKEAMRLYPAVPLLQRCAAPGTMLGGHKITRGMVIVVPIVAVHRHAALWDDPHRFDPSRFAPENEARHHRLQFMPFGAGPRVCIGAAFGTMEATVLLATFIREARFVCPPGGEPEPTARIFLTPKDGLSLQVTMRR